MPHRRLTLVATLVVGVASYAGAVAAADFRGLGDFVGGAAESQAHAISDDGSTVVGMSFSEVGPEPFRWTEKTGLVRLDNTLAVITPGSALAVSQDGAFIAGTAVFDHPEAFLWKTPAFRSLGDLPGEPLSSAAQGVSADGSVVVGTGNYQAGGGPTPVTGEAFRWTQDEGLVGLGDLPGGPECSRALDVSADGSVIVGKGDCGSTFQVEDLGTAYRWTADEGMIDLGYLPGDPKRPSTNSSTATAVSADGSVVVGSSSSATGLQAFRWTQDEGMVGLGTLPGDFYSQAEDANGDGSVIVGSSDTHAFIWTADEGMLDLAGLLSQRYDLDLAGWSLWTATGVSLDGRAITGYGTNPEGQIEAWLARLPAQQVGDTDNDGDVDLSDLANVRNGFGCLGPVQCFGDTFPFDGVVDLADLNSVRNHFRGSTGSSAVPEPATLTLLAGAVLAWMACMTKPGLGGAHRLWCAARPRSTRLAPARGASRESYTV